MCFSYIPTDTSSKITHPTHGTLEVEYYNLPPSISYLSSSMIQHNDVTKQATEPSTLTPPPSPPTSEDTQNNNKEKSDKNGQHIEESVTSVSTKEPRRPPRACDSTDTMLASAATSIHNYYNLINFENRTNDIFSSEPVTPPPPRLPKRRPFLVTQSRSQSPPSSQSFGNHLRNFIKEHNVSDNKREKSCPTPSYPLEEDFQHHAVENGFNSNFAGSRVGIQGGPPPLRRMSAGSRGSFSSLAQSATAFNNNNESSVPFTENHSKHERNTQMGNQPLDAGAGIIATTESNPTAVSSNPMNSITNPPRLVHGYRNGSSNSNAASTAFCNNNGNNNTKHSRRFHQSISSSANSSMRKSGRRSASQGGSACRCKSSKIYIFFLYYNDEISFRLINNKVMNYQ